MQGGVARGGAGARGRGEMCSLNGGALWAQGAASKVWDQPSGCPSVVCCHGGALPMLSSLGKTARALQAKLKRLGRGQAAEAQEIGG
eukprot:4458914-Prymnesium_polylepis.1